MYRAFIILQPLCIKPIHRAYALSFYKKAMHRAFNKKAMQALCTMSMQAFKKPMHRDFISLQTLCIKPMHRAYA